MTNIRSHRVPGYSYRRVDLEGLRHTDEEKEHFFDISAEKEAEIPNGSKKRIPNFVHRADEPGED
ncbi:hypothetical protein ACOJUR_09035 [Alicyclobacillus tolerans]|uniref:Uncharacterized protein n=2 Tax=Alicyclobacillus tolerans TaxID=90970 RepID=A0ABT9LVD7_9BACL|nr:MULTISPECIES: hypothetical protein [Alicyclobacillus]MDP9728238.1 hypothetical protein [Alicyclobacillus tengchongensis]QRF23452.1 hypothetical protein FY534_07075 [Alicyclobacillus sp. TC]SHJ81732.1 hypothetical protein SAMN05443507_10426 [Alicyclobacillus montanus]